VLNSLTFFIRPFFLFLKVAFLAESLQIYASFTFFLVMARLGGKILGLGISFLKHSTLYI
jgi:hypothetical protein